MAETKGQPATGLARPGQCQTQLRTESELHFHLHWAVQRRPRNLAVALHRVFVTDVPNHILRLFETHATFPNNPPVINGLKLSEIWQRGLAEIADGAGRTSSYYLFVMENGDKFFVRNENIIQPATAGKLTGTGVGHITGGTGKLGTIQGIVRQLTTFDPIAGALGDSQIDIDYSMGK